MRPRLRLAAAPLRAFVLAVAVLAATAPALADEAPLAYQQPSPAVRAVLDAPALPLHLVSPDQRTLALLQPRRYRALAELARPQARLAGERIDLAGNGPARINEIEQLQLRELLAADAPMRRVELPAGGGFHQPRWSPDGRWLLLNRRTDAGTELWAGAVAELLAGRAGALRRIEGLRLNAALEDDMAWVGPDRLLALAVPRARGAAPAAALPPGPVVQESSGRRSPERTLQDLLRYPQDEALFRHLAVSVLAEVDLAGGSVRERGEPALYARLQVAGHPDGAPRLLTETLLEPFSYQVGWRGFARRVELRDDQGRVVRELGRIARREGVAIGGVVAGPRQFWASPAGDGAVYWVEALDGGVPTAKVPHRDRLMRLDPPYTAAPVERLRTAGRITQLGFVDGGASALLADFERESNRLRTQLVALHDTTAARVLNERSMRDRYRDPGQPLTRQLANGRSVLRADGGALWLFGAGASAEGERPFVDRLRLADGRSERLFQASASHYERPLALLDADGGRLLTLRESSTEPPHLVLREGAGLAEAKPLTRVDDPTPQLRGIRRELVRFPRADGVELSFWLYLPPDHQSGQRRPALVWAYPREFSDADTAGQVSGAANRFERFGGSSPLMHLLDGYVVLMDATMPVVGDPRTVNDRFIEQITANAQAIVDKAVELGVADRERIAVAGHSYGAFMTANLLAHSRLFKAGIARSGAYNRTLTPFGFQAERRHLWEAQDVYLKLSPFLAADRIAAPLLLIHGEDDDNPGTFPMQSQRLYQAMAGIGGRARFVSLPLEGHGYQARESVGHVLHETGEWLRRHLGEARGAR